MILEKFLNDASRLSDQNHYKGCMLSSTLIHKYQNVWSLNVSQPSTPYGIQEIAQTRF